MKAVAASTALALCTVLALALPVSAACYRKVGSVCKGGYASGYSSDCMTPCSTGAKRAKRMTARPAEPQPAAAQLPKPHQVISPSD